MTDPLHEQRRENLSEHLTKSELSRSEFARKTGVSRSYLSQILSDGFRFGEKAARSFEGKLRLPAGALDEEGDSGLKVITVWGELSDLPDDSYAFVPRISVHVDTDAAVEELGDVLPPLAFRTEWLKKKEVTTRDNLRTRDVMDDSMEPYLEVGDSVLIDTGQTEVITNEAYVIRYGDELRIRRLSRRFDGGLFLRADNPRYPEEHIEPEKVERIAIVGRVLWRGGGLL
jgi:transcriptional regulator with XRE-family HTH domain